MKKEDRDDLTCVVSLIRSAVVGLVLISTGFAVGRWLGSWAACFGFWVAGLFAAWGGYIVAILRDEKRRKESFEAWWASMQEKR